MTGRVAPAGPATAELGERQQLDSVDPEILQVIEQCDRVLDRAGLVWRTLPCAERAKVQLVDDEVL